MVLVLATFARSTLILSSLIHSDGVATETLILRFLTISSTAYLINAGLYFLAICNNPISRDHPKKYFAELVIA